ncbi:uncharacterized protein K452DRAFT_147672 [Aplosporella prunicola CBS 121167]|uniref:Uncharacterized protein n=1 Tax=Aplosporella prunicola CBS 121167 TaxID=1176127 RepID=A0A6A6BPP9_9PEZI|nr:uncharacterized protein K452DRAFT_147672 [Aplosporella prunicola CBS 121167]KAF2144807.1 hypothetical protein K452DRAFT_147672 [Aplosporella prunicola CBS 121167]
MEWTSLSLVRQEGAPRPHVLIEVKGAAQALDHLDTLREMNYGPIYDVDIWESQGLHLAGDDDFIGNGASLPRRVWNGDVHMGNSIGGTSTGSHGTIGGFVTLERDRVEKEYGVTNFNVSLLSPGVREASSAGTKPIDRLEGYSYYIPSRKDSTEMLDGIMMEIVGVKGKLYESNNNFPTIAELAGSGGIKAAKQLKNGLKAIDEQERFQKDVEKNLAETTGTLHAASAYTSREEKQGEIALDWTLIEIDRDISWRFPSRSGNPTTAYTIPTCKVSFPHTYGSYMCVFSA